ncbi:Stp1/IreP family PP2C-type Ser/Thr phosphatase [Acutalibacter caecimuris]|uniref:Stp1/IreP family PP2C-type Ser/Thr phosphatase n=1 Tax=Acutalibacter caecimuris TaxID=3093657 RepID=UPI002AC8DA7C|nr:Stp1/IreP family PP2C-type Ser/Thr phosphatase [Acutalibacter sp. M00118]
MRVDFATDTGPVRSTNQDACRCGLFSQDSAWAVVCDGMGGANGGNIASSIAVEQIEEQLTSHYAEDMSPGSIKSMLVNAIYRANTAIFETAKEKAELRGMGTTAVVLLAAKGQLHVAHVGDSRAYLKNRGGLTQLTMDHSYVQDLVNFGQITKEQARTHPRRNIITRVLGVHDAVSADYSVWDFHSGDVALACTDGLTGYMEDSMLEEYIEKHGGSGEKLTGQLVRYAVDCGGADNITVAVVNNT